MVQYILMPIILLIIAVYSTFSLRSTALINVHLVGHTHDDVGWLKTVDQYYMGLNKSIDPSSVQFILDTLTHYLAQSPDRKFSYVEQAYFQRWWRRQSDKTKDSVKALVKNGQLEFINGGWCMHDEATTHYADMIDQTSLGHRFLKDEFGALPKVGWQIDPFGHSSTQAALLSGEVGFEGLFFARMDYQDFDARFRTNRTEWIWRASPSLGLDSQVFTGIFQWSRDNLYGPPPNMCFDITCQDQGLQDDPTLEDYNVDSKVEEFVQNALRQASVNVGDDIMWLLGFDFMWEAAEEWFKNLDILIDAVNKDGRVKTFYSTPSQYVEAKNKAGLTWTVKSDDLFPYSDGPHGFWTGYFTSRAALKRYVAYDYARRLARGLADASAMAGEVLANLTAMEGASLPRYSTCPLTNISECAHARAEELIFTLYNPLARSRTELIEIPIHIYTNQTLVSDAPITAAAVSPTTMTSAKDPKTAAPYTLRFLIVVPALGFRTVVWSNVSSTSEQTRLLRRARRSGDTPFFLYSVQPSFAAPAAVDCSKNPSFTNGIVGVTFDQNCSLVAWDNPAAGQGYPFTQNFFYYPSFQQPNDQDSGAYIFRPAQANQMAIPVTTNPIQLTIINTTVSIELTQVFTPWLQQTIRLISGNRLVTFEWTVGPVPIDDGQGKEIITRWSSKIISNNQTFFTDSNGREFMTRIFNYRPTWNLTVTEPVAGNYYPLNTGLILPDPSSPLSIATDRSQGCASLNNGEVEVMIQRRTLSDDARGVGEPMNETQAIFTNGTRIGPGIVVTGQFVADITHPDEMTAYESLRASQSRIYSPIQVFIATLTDSPSNYTKTHRLSQSMIITPLPINVELLSFYALPNGSTIIRLAHQFAINEDKKYSVAVTVDLNVLFIKNVTNVVELSLTANQPAGNIQRLNWNTNDSESDMEMMRVKKTRTRELKDGTVVTIAPMEIRTFQVDFI